MLKFESKSINQTIKFGKAAGRLAKPNFIFGLNGDLGSGKTTFTKGIANALGIKKENVISSSFVLVREHGGSLPFFHFDFYRIETLEEMQTLGVEEYFNSGGVCVIEWADKLREILPEELISVNFSYGKKNSRSISIETRGKKYSSFIKDLERQANECISF